MRRTKDDKRIDEAAGKMADIALKALSKLPEAEQQKRIDAFEKSVNEAVAAARAKRQLRRRDRRLVGAKD
jgi:hypothetical protein